MGERAAKAKELIGWATGDRKVEAEGRVETAVASDEDPRSEPTDDEVEAELLVVRGEHGDIQSDRSASP